MTKIGGHTPYIGHTWRLCPYSTQYKEMYYDNGYLGNSLNPDLPVPTSDHPTTDGTMISAMRPGVWGFSCLDENCYYFITYGKRYFEA